MEITRFVDELDSLAMHHSNSMPEPKNLNHPTANRSETLRPNGRSTSPRTTERPHMSAGMIVLDLPER